jgi:hypothetical protein
MLKISISTRFLHLLFIMTLLISGCDEDRNMPHQDASRASSAGKTADEVHWPKSFGFGRKATDAEITALDIDVSPDGHGLPAGAGNVVEGGGIYKIKCASCHGMTGTEGPFNRLVGVMGDTIQAKTIGNYWPYATTLFDYIRRSMPYNAPGSLTNREVYGLTAFLLYKNRVIDSVTVMDAISLPKIKMPAHDLFVNDDRHGGPEIR